MQISAGLRTWPLQGIKTGLRAEKIKRGGR